MAAAALTLVPVSLIVLAEAFGGHLVAVLATLPVALGPAFLVPFVVAIGAAAVVRPPRLRSLGRPANAGRGR